MNIRVTALSCAVLTFAFAVSSSHRALADPATATAGAVRETTSQDVPFPDVPENSWVYDAIRRLAADGYIAGVPVATVPDGRPMTRYEVSYLINKAVTAMKRQIAQGEHPSAVDLALVNKLAVSAGADLKDVSGRIDALQSETAALKTQADALKKQADASTENLRAFQIKVNYFARPGTFDQNVVAVNGPTTLRGTIAPGQVLPGGTGPAPIGSGLFGATGQGTSIGQNVLDSGNYQHGVNFQQTRIVFTGQPSTNFTYYVRLENKYSFSTPNYQSISTPAFCTSTTPATLAGVNACQSQGYDTGNTPVRLNQSWLSYSLPSGLFAKFGRWQEDEGTASSLGLSMGGNYVNGLQLGYKNKRLSTYTAYAFGDTALTNIALNNVNCPVGVTLCANQSQQVMLGMVSYDLSSRTNIGATYDDYIGSAFTLWNPGAGLCAPTASAPAETASATTLNLRVACPANTALITTPMGPVTGVYQSATTPLVTGSVNVTQFIGPKMKLTAEYMHRFGKDPFTNSAWLGSDAVGVQFDYATRGMTRPGPLFPGLGIKNSNVYEVAFVAAGFNGLSPDPGPAGTTPYQSFFFNSLNGYAWSWVTAQHWWSDTVRTGIVYHHFQTLPGVFQPAGAVTCPGCYLKKVNANAMFLETYLNM